MDHLRPIPASERITFGRFRNLWSFRRTAGTWHESANKAFPAIGIKSALEHRADEPSHSQRAASDRVLLGDVESSEIICDSVNRIQWVLSDVLPGIEDEPNSPGAFIEDQR
jgi:hypothetical protein